GGRDAGWALVVLGELRRVECYQVVGCYQVMVTCPLPVRTPLVIPDASGVRPEPPPPPPPRPPAAPPPPKRPPPPPSSPPRPESDPSPGARRNPKHPPAPPRWPGCPGDEHRTRTPNDASTSGSGSAERIPLCCQECFALGVRAREDFGVRPAL